VIHGKEDRGQHLLDRFQVADRWSSVQDERRQTGTVAIGIKGPFAQSTALCQSPTSQHSDVRYQAVNRWTGGLVGRCEPAGSLSVPYHPSYRWSRTVFSQAAEKQPHTRYHGIIRSVRCPGIKEDGRHAYFRYHNPCRLSIPLCGKSHEPARLHSVPQSLSLDSWADSFYLVFHHLHEDRLRILDRIQSVVPCHPQVFE
jgi:hypothetical protein